MEYKSIDHATHNEEACKHLLKNTTFNDWIITTAFYSALHFADHKLFPLNYAGIEYESFDEFYNGIRPSRSRHSERNKLVNRHFDLKHAAVFKKLFSDCHNARYSQYKYPPEMAQEAKNRLDGFKKYCLK